MLSKINAFNFQSWKRLEFSVTKGVTLIDGWNEDDQTSEGSGKSAVLNALCWNLYGKLPKDAKIDDVIKHGETSCLVESLYSTGDIIHRSRKPNDLYIKTATGKIIKGKDAKETQELIEEFVGCNFETFCQSVYYAQNYDKKFLSSDQETKGKILSSIQNLSVFDKARKEVMELLKIEVEKEQTLKNKIQIEENNIKNIESQQALITSFIDTKIQQHKIRLSDLTKKSESYESWIRVINGNILDLKNELSTIDLVQIDKDEKDLLIIKQDLMTQLSEVLYKKSQINTIVNEISGREREGALCASKYESLRSKLHRHDSLISERKIQLSHKASKLENVTTHPTYIKLEEKRNKLKEFIKNPTQVCPSCGTELKNVSTAHAEREYIQTDLEQQEYLNQTGKEMELTLKQITEEEAQYKADKLNIELEMQNIVSQLKSISEYLDQNVIPVMDDLIFSEKKIKDTIGQIEHALKDLQLKKNSRSRIDTQLQLRTQDLSHHELLLNQSKKEIDALGEPNTQEESQKLVVLSNQKNQVVSNKNQFELLWNQSTTYLNQLETLKDGFKEIKSYVFNNALNELNFRTNEYLKDLFEIDAFIKFTNEDQKIESTIVIDGRSTSLGLLSGGQNRRFNLAVDLALSDIVSHRKTSKIDILILDEYFRDLSEISMEKCLNILKTRKCPVILIEHNSLFKNIVDNVFFARLENGTSSESRP